MTVFTSNVPKNQVIFHYLMYGQVSAIAFYILKSSNYLLNFCGVIGAEIIYFQGYTFSFFFSRIIMVIVFYAFQDYVVCKSERMSFYLKQKEAEWRSIISKVLPLKVFISEFDYISCNLKLYDCSREAQHYVKNKNSTLKFMDILNKINVDMKTSVLFQPSQQNTASKKERNSKNRKNSNKYQNSSLPEQKVNSNINKDQQSNMIDLKTYLLHRHIGIEKDLQKDRAKRIKINISNPFQNIKKNMNHQVSVNTTKSSNYKGSQEQETIYNDKHFDALNLYKLDTLTGYYFENDEQAVFSEKLKIKIAYYSLFKPLLVVYFEDQTMQNEYINIKEEKQRFDILFIEILEYFRLQFTQILKQGVDQKNLKNIKNKLFLMLNNLYIIFDYYILSQMRKNCVLNLQSQSNELNIKRNTFTINDIFKEIKDIYKETVVIRMQEVIKTSIARMCTNSKIQIAITYTSEAKDLWKGFKFTIYGKKDENISENQILDFFTTDNYQQLNDLTLYVMDSIVKIIGPYNFKSSCSPQDEITFEFTIFEDIGQVFLDQYTVKSQSFRNSPSLTPTPSQKLSFNQALFLNVDCDVTKSSIASPLDNKVFLSSSNVNLNTQNSCKTIESKTQATRFTRAQSQQLNNVCSLLQSNNHEKINRTNPSSKELVGQLNSNNALNINMQHLNESIHSDGSISVSFKNAAKTPVKNTKPILRYSNRKKQSITLNQDTLQELTRNPSIYIDNFKSADEANESPYQKSRMSLFGKNCPGVRITSKSTGQSTDNNINKEDSYSHLSQNKIEESIQEESFTPSRKLKNSETSFNSPQILPKPVLFQNLQQQSGTNNIQQKVIVEINSLLSDSYASSSLSNIKSMGMSFNNSKSIKSEYESRFDEMTKSIDERNTFERSHNNSSTNKIITQSFKCFSMQKNQNRVIPSHNSTLLSQHNNDQDSFL